ncbi:ring-opening amidohydrolase [Roseobacter sp.]|uniref:cyanuric acid amidohydrolase n=1 Tax=Roseobacter sp. TaxID=1907202 RepID=UPI00385904F0
MPRARIHVIPTSSPDDVSGLQRLIATKKLDPTRLIAILGKTEGNGCVNDFTRAFAVSELKRVLGSAADDVTLVMSGGTEGGLSPHLVTFEVLDDAGAGPSMAIGAAITRDLLPHEIGTFAQVDSVAETVRATLKSAGIASVDDVHFVQIKCPLLTSDRIAMSDRPTATTDTLKSMGLSRGASALGVGLALEEIDADTARLALLESDVKVWSGRASTSAGVELMGHEMLVLGMSKGWSGPLIVEHAVMTDAIDTDAVRAALERLEIGSRSDLLALFAKAEASTNGQIRGSRHTMLNDSDISSTRHARAMVGGALGGLVGRMDLFVSGGAEHQGPDGGGPVALIAERRG